MSEKLLCESCWELTDEIIPYDEHNEKEITALFSNYKPCLCPKCYKKAVLKYQKNFKKKNKL